ncbi:hypothetical protein ACW7G2_14015 [Luteimonas sp. A277]
MLKHFAVALLASLLAIGCTTTAERNAVRIDASSIESAETSYKAMMRSQSDSGKQKLAIAMVVLNMEGVESAYEVVANPELQSPSIGGIKDRVAGMTAAEIIALADRTSDVRVEVFGQ